MIEFSQTSLYTLFCVAIRLGLVILFAPIQAIRQLPMRIRLILTFVMSLLLVSYIPPIQAHNDLQLIAAGLSEFMNGLLLLLSIQAAFAVFQIAGYLMDSQMGLNAMAVFNPAEQVQEAFMGRFLSMLAVLIFFSEGYHHLLFQSLKYSFILSPPGEFTLLKDFFSSMHQLGSIFIFSLLLAAPLLTALLAIDISGALLTRNMPQVNTWFLIVPVKILVGILFLDLMLKGMHPLINHIFKIYGGAFS